MAQNFFCLLDGGIIFIIVCKNFGKQIVFELGNNKYFSNVLFLTLNSVHGSCTMHVSCLIVTSLADCPRKLVFFTAMKACGLIFLLECPVEAVAST